jgi:hypothetical protein
MNKFRKALVVQVDKNTQLHFSPDKTDEQVLRKLKSVFTKTLAAEWTAQHPELSNPKHVAAALEDKMAYWVTSLGEKSFQEDLKELRFNNPNTHYNDDGSHAL